MSIMNNPKDDRIKAETVASWDVGGPWTTKTLIIENKLQETIDAQALNRRGRYELVYIPES